MNRAFVTTRWSVVVNAADSDTQLSREALEHLCRTYWFPLYTYTRRRGLSAHDAEDATQEFFARLVEKNWVAQADRSRGRFRSFLLMAMSRFLANRFKMENALKRGGDHKHVPLLDMDTAETRYGHEPADTATPEQAFERQWALTLLEVVLAKLRSEFETGNKTALFDLLKPCLSGGKLQPYSELAEKLGTSESNIKVNVHRMRERYRSLLRNEIAQTVTSEDEIDAELKHLFRALAGKG